MPREVKIDRAIYLVNDERREYRILRSNPAWRHLEPKENDANKRTTDGYTRTMRSGRKKTYVRSEHP